MRTYFYQNGGITSEAKDLLNTSYQGIKEGPLVALRKKDYKKMQKASKKADRKLSGTDQEEELRRKREANKDAVYYDPVRKEFYDKGGIFKKNIMAKNYYQPGGRFDEMLKLKNDLEDIYNSGDVDYNNHVPDGYSYNVTDNGEPYYTDQRGRRIYRTRYENMPDKGGADYNALSIIPASVRERALSKLTEQMKPRGKRKFMKNYFDKFGNKTGELGDVPSKQQGGQISQEEYEYYADIVAGAYQGDQERQNFIQQVFTAAQQGDEQAAQVATILQQIMEQYQQAQRQRNGGRLLKAGGVINYINKLRNGVPLGYGVRYERRGGRMYKQVVKKAEKSYFGGTINSFQKGGDLKG